MIILICGYRRTGKDTLYEILKGNNSFVWRVYSKNVLNIYPKAIQKSFALELKRYVSKKYSIPEYIPDNEKDLKIYDGKSARDLYIFEGERKRSKNINYWCDRLNLDDDKDYVITDLRYRNEVNYFKNKEHVTIRVFRSDVEIPDKDIDSEHDLDGFKTDYLLVTSKEEFKKCLEIFPQYSDYEFKHMTNIE